ncbi:peptidoglycan DD-metalloendopeptidase family protein [Ornithinimicrobium sp.]|uniref:peptidoglycan DD-metalloendopeptidase family protein n=1 Tax=Ornithinimicrobium sp. TaxID=1977084 RepID=UPI0026DF429E|nr:peptidoglycan DD-metalloendopeptidase family protein [Ornithinimicrobium sp.]
MSSLSSPPIAASADRAASRGRRTTARRLRSAVVLSLAGMLVAGPALAGDLDDLRDRIRQVEQQESKAEKAQGNAATNADALTEDLTHTSAKLVAADARLKQTNAKVGQARIELAAAEEELADAEAEAERIQTELGIARANEATIEEGLKANEIEQEESLSTVGAIARDSYKQGGIGSLATTLEILSGETDAVDRMAMARTVLRVQDQQIRTLATAQAQAVAEQDRLVGVRRDIDYLLAQAQANVIAKEQARAVADGAKRSLESLEAQQAKDKTDLEAEKAKVQADLEAEQDRSNELEAQLAELATTKHGLKVKEKTEVKRIAAEEARRRAAAEAERVAAEQAAADEAARQRAAEREAQRQRDAAAAAQQRQDADAAAQAQRRAAAAQADADAAARAQRAAADRAATVAPAPAPAPASAPPPPPPTESVKPSNYLSFPVNAPTTSEFGMRLHPILGIWLLHSGLDFGAPCGAPIRAAASGTVYGTLFDNSRGNYVVIDHGVTRGVNLTTAYLHLESFAVSSGQSVSVGQVIGYEGTTGSSTGCHLHFETRENGTPTNPRGWL